MDSQSKIIIAIDGYSSCGKSTLAKGLASALNYIYIDTGAMYRAVTLYLLEKKVDLDNRSAISSALNRIEISFENIDGLNTTFLNGKSVEDQIRSKRVADYVSEISSISEVRAFLKVQQQALGINKGIVMDGRDIATVIFPEAELKFFLTADIDIRSQRRFQELQLKGLDDDSYEGIRANLMKRDFIDANREHAPLVKSNDSIEIDTTNLKKEEQLELALNFAKSRLRNAVII